MVAKNELPTELSPGTNLNQGYRIVRTLGQGAMGRVYESVKIETDKRWALKQTFYDKGLERDWFENEAKQLGKCQHPSLPEFHEYFKEGGSYFFAMQLIDGPSLKEMLDEKGAIPVNTVLEIAKKILDAMAHLETKKIVHKDIKPDNIRVEKDNVFLVDFGLAKDMTTGTVVPAHTPHYAPPEQTEVGRITNHQSDIYSFGATLYHMLTAELPPKAHERQIAVHDGQPDPLRFPPASSPEVSEALAEVVYRSMALESNDRFRSAHEMLGALVDSTEAVKYFEKGKELLKGKKYSGAIQKYTQAIKRRAGFAEAYLGRGKAYIETETYDYAINDLSKAIELNSDLSDAYFWRAWAYAITGHAEPCIADYSKVIEISPKNGSAYNNRGREHEKKNRFALALLDYNQAIELDANETMYYNNRARAHLGQAATDLKRVIKADGDSSDYKDAITQLGNLERLNSRGFPIGIAPVIVGFLLVFGMLLSDIWLTARQNAATAEQKRLEAEFAVQAIKAEKDATERKANQAEENLTLAQAKLAGKEVWRLAAIENRTGQKITYYVRNGYGSWNRTTSEPQSLWHHWTENNEFLVKFKGAENGKEKEYQIPAKIVIGHTPTAEERSEAPRSFFSAVDKGDIDLIKAP